MKEERIYLGGYEIYRKYTGSTLDLERITVHIMDDTGRIAMYEKRTSGTDGSPATLQRYVYSNHLSTASLELDEDADIISYEEYHPYGTTAYQAMNSTINAVAKRYRYTGKERDEETGLYYYGARYYMPWLCRWGASDPLQGKMPTWSSYNYGFCNPVKWNDKDGMEPGDGKDKIIRDQAIPTQKVDNLAHAPVILPDGGFVSGRGSSMRPEQMQDVVVTAKRNPTSGFWEGFGKSTLRGITNAIDHVVNNPNYAGYGGGTLPSTGAPPTVEDFKKYEINWSNQLDPNWQIENFSNNLVYGTYNFVGGISQGNGERTAQAIPPLVSSIGTLSLLKGYSPQPSIPIGLAPSEFLSVSQKIMDRVGDISKNIVIQGSRADGSAVRFSDIDIAIKVPSEEFSKIISSRFGTPNPGSAKFRTMEHAIATGKIQAGEAGLSSFRKELEKTLGIDVDISIIKIGGPFDNGKQIPIKRK